MRHRRRPFAAAAVTGTLMREARWPAPAAQEYVTDAPGWIRWRSTGTARARRAGPPQGQSPARGAPDAGRAAARLDLNTAQFGNATRCAQTRCARARRVSWPRWPLASTESRSARRRGTVEAVTRSPARVGATRPGSMPEPARSLPLRVPSLLQELRDERLTSAGVRLLLKRDDLINPDVPGNKWRKLKYNLAEAQRS